MTDFDFSSIPSDGGASEPVFVPVAVPLELEQEVFVPQGQVKQPVTLSFTVDMERALLQALIHKFGLNLSQDVYNCEIGQCVFDEAMPSQFKQNVYFSNHSKPYIQILSHRYEPDLLVSRFRKSQRFEPTPIDCKKFELLQYRVPKQPQDPRNTDYYTFTFWRRFE